MESTLLKHWFAIMCTITIPVLITAGQSISKFVTIIKLLCIGVNYARHNEPVHACTFLRLICSSFTLYIMIKK